MSRIGCYETVLLRKEYIFCGLFLAGIGKKYYLCNENRHEILPIKQRMEYISVIEYARQHGISERTARNYCASGKIAGAFLTGKTWNIPVNASLPARKNAKHHQVSSLLAILREQKKMGMKGGIYHKTQIDLTYNSNHIEGSRLTHEQTRYIFETNTIGLAEREVHVDDIIETMNHFRCIDYIIEHAEEKLSEAYIKHLHFILKSSTSDSRKAWFSTGEYKQLPNEVGGHETCPPEQVSSQMKELLCDYHAHRERSLHRLLDFHVRFERIHPFQDGNGRVGRLILFKECLVCNIVPFIITDELKMFYYRGLNEWGHIDEYLTETCLTAQDEYKKSLDYFRIKY